MTTYATTRAVSTADTRDRVVVGGVDISYFRGKALPFVPYRLLEPFGYGSATIRVPQVRPYLEAGAFGSGDLSWVKTGAFVKIQRVDPDTGEVVAKDYRGRVMAIRASGPELVLEVGGLVTGPASIRNHQVPVYRRVKDIGTWMFDSVVNYGNFPGVEFTPRLGPTTGIDAVETGGMSHLGWMQQLCSLAVTKSGAQWTVMPTEAGGKTFEMRLKDTTTKHATLYLDDARVVADLVDDAAETFNAGFGSGVTDEGMIWDGTVLPGVEDPGKGEAPFGGTTLAIGSSGDQVVAVNYALIGAGYLSREDASSLYDQETADAVEQFQDRSGLPQTGNVNKATWDALFDISASEWDITHSRIMPLVERSSVREWNYTSTGAKIGRNPDYNPHKLRCDRNIDFGAGVDEQAARRWMRGQMQRLSGKSWVGTITLNKIGAIAGEHNPGDPQPLPADVLSARDIQAGWNVWLANFDGGTLVHVADVQVDAETVTLTVDTHYRDAIDLGEIIRRNKESRRDLRREWVMEYRGSKKIHDAITPFNKKAGINFHKRTAKANTWTVWPVFAGEAGTVSKFRIVTDNSKAAFCYAVFADRISAKALNAHVPNPWPLDKDGETVWVNHEDWITSRFLLYSGGNTEQPGGYWPKKHTNRDRETVAENPITGIWQDDASFGYATFKLPALWIAIHPSVDTVVQRGRQVWAQIDTGL